MLYLVLYLQPDLRHEPLDATVGIWLTAKNSSLGVAYQGRALVHCVTFSASLVLCVLL